jgi:hypothetical protein
LTLRASGSTVLGGQIAAAATLAGGVRITGVLTLSVYADCSLAPLRSTTVAVNGDGVYAAAPLATRAAGTYHWVASYAGDADNSPAATACGDPLGTTTVAGTAAAAPSNLFHLGAARADRSGRIRVALSSPDAGQFRATATALANRTTFGRTSVSLRAAAPVVMLIAPSAAARSLLRHHTRVRVSVAITFAPTGGQAHTRRVTVTVRGKR